MPKLPEKSSDEILNEWKEAYKTEPNKYKEKLAGVVYSSWYYMVPKSEECQKYPLTCLCDFDVNRVIDEMVYGKKFPKEKIRFNFFATLMNEAKKYCEEEEYFLSLVLYATYIEHWFNDLINCLAITKNLDDNATEKLIKMFTNDARLDILLPLFNLPEIDKDIKNDLKILFDTRNYFVHYKWKPKDEKEGAEQIQKFIDYSKKAPKIIEYLNNYVKQNIYNREFLKKFFANLIYRQSGIIVKE
ncbi:MAG: hypothetical protein DKM22_06815 [Candidatus Melainabacteria bacterium]|nr:MAG: hypothetical protein DKM22_06815 [Candidatus Melainabacteria bacterium]